VNHLFTQGAGDSGEPRRAPDPHHRSALGPQQHEPPPGRGGPPPGSPPPDTSMPVEQLLRTETV